MRLHAFNFCGSGDRELAQLMETTLRKHAGERLVKFKSYDMDAAGYGNGAGWEAAMLKLEKLGEIVADADDNDWILSVDSDVVFCNSNVFEWLHYISILKYYTYHLCGLLQVTDRAKTAIGELLNASGCCMFIRAAHARKMATIPSHNLSIVRQEHFKGWVLCENEDIVLSYLSQMLGGNHVAFPDHLYHGNFEEDLKTGELKSFYHLNYLPESFLGEPTTGKWDIPRVLRSKGIEL